MTFTDPPYNVDYGSSAKDKLRGNKRKILNDDLGGGFEAFLQRRLRQHPRGHQGRGVRVHASVGAAHAAAGVHDGRRQVDHVRDLGKAHLHARPRRLPKAIRTDPVWLARGSRSLLVRRAGSGRRLVRGQAGAQRSASHDEAGGLVERAIRNSSKTRDIVLDPFGGSGSTLIACEKAGRQARLVELDPKYCDVIIRRWQECSGGTAMLEETTGATMRPPRSTKLRRRDQTRSLNRLL